MTCDEAKHLLDARLDEELHGALRAQIDAHTRTCGSCAEELDNLRRLSEAIRGSIHSPGAPAHLRDNIRFALRGAAVLERRSRMPEWRSWGAVAAGLMVLTALGSTPFLVNARNQRRALADEIVSAHERALAGRELDVISTDRHTVKPWFNGKIPFSPPVADFRPEGFPLEGGRVDYIGARPVAALVYGRRLHRIDVFVWPVESSTPPARFDRNGFHEISWTRDTFAFTCVSDLDPAELTVLVNLLKRG
jgi:anti-sigma factor RsiW